jgi:uncharacterized protein
MKSLSMKSLLIMVGIIVSSYYVRADQPGFLDGTWKIDNEEKFEHLDMMTKVSDNKSDMEHLPQSLNPDYDAALAKRLGADAYGMKSYVLLILKTGSNTTANQEETALAFRGHMENISRLSEEGKLIVAGPIGRNERNYRGIFIFDVDSIEDARDLVQTDPAVAAGLLEADLYSWYGSAALPLYLEAAGKIWKEQP